MARRAQRLPKYILAILSGISRPYLNAIESGKADVRLSTVQNMAEALSLEPLALLSQADILDPPD